MTSLDLLMISKGLQRKLQNLSSDEAMILAFSKTSLRIAN